MRRVQLVAALLFAAEHCRNVAAFPKEFGSQLCLLRPGDNAGLALALKQRPDTSPAHGLHPHFRRLHATLCEAQTAPASDPSAPRRLAVLVSGAVRATPVMTRADLVAGYRRVFEAFLGPGQGFATRAFVYLDLLGNATRRDAELAVRGWGVPFELQFHGDTAPGTLHPHAQAPEHECRGFACTRASMDRREHCLRLRAEPAYAHEHGSGHRGLQKIAAATAMMRRHEEQQEGGRPFDVVLRMRADFCLEGGHEMFRRVMPHVSRCSGTVALVHDGLAVYPRWAADAVANLWRSNEGCSAQPPVHGAASGGWAPECRLEHEPDGACEGRGGVRGASTPIQDHFLRYGISSLNVLAFWCNQSDYRTFQRCKNRLALRRPSSCWPFS